MPAQDAEIEEHYFNLLDAGDICAKESSMAKDALKKIFCAACSPQQPTYVADGKFKICSSLAQRVVKLFYIYCEPRAPPTHNYISSTFSIAIISSLACENGRLNQHVLMTAGWFGLPSVAVYVRGMMW